jgi:hypothetical protein
MSVEVYRVSLRTSHCRLNRVSLATKMTQIFLKLGEYFIGVENARSPAVRTRGSAVHTSSLIKAINQTDR